MPFGTGGFYDGPQRILSGSQGSRYGHDRGVGEKGSRCRAFLRAQILNDGLIGGMAIIGQEFKCRDLWVPDVLLAARNMHRGIEILKPFFAQGAQGAKGKILLGTVKGDIHDIGKNLVSIMMSGSGFEVIDLGIDVSLEKFMAAARGTQAPDHRPFRPPDHHDDGNEQGHRSGESQFPVAQT